MTIELYHFCPKPFELDRNKEYVLEKFSFKPRGMWLSDETCFGWKQWCEIEYFNIENLKHTYKVHVNMDNVLHISSYSKLVKFSKKFQQREILENNSLVLYTHIDWEKVMAMYNGILISPYRNDARLKYVWYYGWDCASACIWNLNNIVSITQEK